MLASWMRFKYPNAIDGAIAASAPIFTFEGEDPTCDPNFFARGVTYDVSEAGGASTPWCEANFREAFAKGRLVAAGETPEGRAALAEAFQLCAPLGDDAEAGWLVADWLDEALSYMAMGVSHLLFTDRCSLSMHPPRESVPTPALQVRHASAWAVPPQPHLPLPLCSAALFLCRTTRTRRATS